MSNYAEKSDFEINREVANILYPCAEYIPDQEDAWVDTYTECQVIRKVGYDGFIVDYCNNPLDAFPIIIENRIMLNPYCANDEWKAEAPVENDGFSTTYAACYHKNPLRAAAVVFLMLKGNQK